MKEKRSVTRELSIRYQKASKKQKGIMLDEFTALTGYNQEIKKAKPICHKKSNSCYAYV